MATLTVSLSRLCRDERGQDLIEYVLLAALLAVACIAAMDLISSPLSNLFTSTINALTGAGS